MTKQDLIVALSEHSPFFLSEDVGQAVTLLLESIQSALEKGERVEIRGFGSFASHQRPPRLSRNPRTGKVITVPESRAIHFKPGKELRDSIKDDFGRPMK